MTTLDKEYFRKDGAFHRRELEKVFGILSLNETQKQVLREIIDRILEAQQREHLAPNPKLTN